MRGGWAGLLSFVRITRRAKRISWPLTTSLVVGSKLFGAVESGPAPRCPGTHSPPPHVKTLIAWIANPRQRGQRRSDRPITSAAHCAQTHMWPHGTNACVLGLPKHTVHITPLSLDSGGAAVDDDDDDDDAEEDDDAVADDASAGVLLLRALFCWGSTISSPPASPASRSRFFAFLRIDSKCPGTKNQVAPAST